MDHHVATPASQIKAPPAGTQNDKVLHEALTQTTQLAEHFQTLRDSFKQAPYPDIEQRIGHIQAIKDALINNKQALTQALNDDYGYRSHFDSLLADIVATVQHANYTLKHIRKWLKPNKRHAGLMLFPSTITVHQQPLGVVGVITPWNFPVNLSISPAITALAAGNRVMIKLSEFTPNTNQVLKSIFEPLSDQMVFVEGEVEVSTAFSSLPFDHLFFTGSTEVGKYVARAAAENLTPITLELGGKSPVVIDDSFPIKRAVDAILTGKTINSGQICVAPDYIWLPKARQQEFIDTYVKRFKHFYGNQKQASRHGCIINSKQLERLHRYLDDAREQGASILSIDTDRSAENGYLAPHLITDVSDNMLIMQNEIFGSLLPIMGYDEIEQAFSYIAAKPRPLAYYLMSEDKALIERTTQQTHSGGLSINDTLLHVAAEDAPFGGIGHSGMGHYHGIEGFKTFSHSKTVLKTASWLPRSALMLKYRDLMAKVLGKVFLR